MTTLAAQQFARVIIAMQPYVDDIVFVGGWVHALYLAAAIDARVARTRYPSSADRWLFSRIPMPSSISA